ncbi:ribonuclease activity regulator protein RraA [Alcanivorax xiamenensis]|uniref:4-hydroxy-4-methyl-2-oxoglutarate aldolase n=1 Tax=Alcanivorax xiamenensis TaxID=1177156 RepID=A0ABQ6Y7K0_9GAMM|nr:MULTISPECIES: ribonuclease E activity regulator RraA [Alcanivorax]KAF0805460.1 ribonuclease activity regulator protein RraA [Alcanivorax xiamenensis]
MTFVTCDLCDEHADKVSVVTGLNWFSYGGRQAFGGEIVTVKCFEDNSRVKEHLATDGKGRVLVVDGGGSLRNALIGDMIAENAVSNGWEGVIIHGACRDVLELAKLDLGVVTLGCVPIKSVRRGEGQLNIDITFGGVTFRPGDFVYADANGVITSTEALL